MRRYDTLTYRGQAGRMRQLGHGALADYGIAGARLRLLGHDENTTFRVVASDGRRYLLRIHRVSGNPAHPVRSAIQVRSELLWLAALRRDTGLAVPEPVPTLDGRLLTEASIAGVPERRLCTLFRWQPGRFLHAGLTPAHLERVGRLIAQLHQHAESWTPPAEFTRGRVGDVSEPAAAHMLCMVAELCTPADVATVAAVIARVRATQQALDQEPGAYGLIHGDLHQENYLFDHGQVYAIDFDDCGWGYFLYDLMMPVNELADHPRYADLRAALLRGYRSLRLLPPAHARHMAIFDALKVLILTIWFLDERDKPAFQGWQAEVRGNLDWLADWLTRDGRWGTGDRG
jgi:Ser/Thr protein kinase RdoA (MazF antagonist)